jgi:phosphatidate cytidylyltransferase
LKNLIIRTVSGIVFLIFVIGSLLLGKYYFGTLFLLVGILALLEFYQLTGNSGNTPGNIPGLIAGSVIYIVSFLVASQLADYKLLSITVIFPALFFIMALYNPKSDLGKNLSITFLGIIYVILPLALLNYLAFPASNKYVYTPRIVVGILTLVWISDTAAYLCGTLLGRHKLFPRISPKKSWEGLIGGALLTLIPSFWMDDLMGILSRTDWIILAVIVTVFGIYGDLTESLIKRNAGMKDSGSIMPGHGGMLDRFDSILFVVPVSFLYLIMNGL